LNSSHYGYIYGHGHAKALDSLRFGFGFGIGYSDADKTTVFPPKTKKKERKIEKPSSRSSEKLLVETVGRQIMHAVAALRFSLSASFLLFGKL